MGVTYFDGGGREYRNWVAQQTKYHTKYVANKIKGPAKIIPFPKKDEEPKK